MKEFFSSTIIKTAGQLRSFVLLLLFILFTLIPVCAQNGSIKGKILDSKTREPLIGAAAIIDKTSNGAAADLDGDFIIGDIRPGTYALNVSYVSYKPLTRTGIVVRSGETAEVEILLDAESVNLETVVVVAKANRESENILLMEQKKALVAEQTVGARELSRKGVSDAQDAVAKVSGISKQDGVKNVFVRGLGDRYNTTLLNGFPIPSEEPEYKNIALEFFTTGVIQNIGVNKVFRANNSGDVGGAIIHISSKKLFADQAFGAEASAGINTQAAGRDFLRQDGSDYFGFARSSQPPEGKFAFPNKLNPSVQSLPLSQHFGISGGKRFFIGENRKQLSFYAVASHNSDYSYTREIVRNTYTDGHIYIDQKGEKYSQKISQLVLGNINFAMNGQDQLNYNFMMVHANNQYVGRFEGKNEDKYQAAADYHYDGFLMRQQTNDNLLFVHQLSGDWNLYKSLKLSAGASYNAIKGKEPDRRVNNLYKTSPDTYRLTGSNSQKRFFSVLDENDFNVRAELSCPLPNKYADDASLVLIGYTARFVSDDFKAEEYDLSAATATIRLDDLDLDGIYNAETLANGDFKLTKATPDTYTVRKHIHSGYAEGTYRAASKLTANAGLRVDFVNLEVNHNVKGIAPGKETISKPFFLPGLNAKYEIDDKNTLRLGLSKTYTLPQSKEISPYIYVSLNFNSQGNKDLKPSDNYNADLKWDYYLSPSELISAGTFVKHIANPISKVEEGSSGGYLTYRNIGKHATVAGIEIEIRKNIFAHTSTADQRKANRLSLGLNASYIYSNLEVDVMNTEKRKSALEGAAPLILNSDVSYVFIDNNRTFTNSLVLNYFSDRIYTIGTIGYNDIIEKGIATLDFVSSAKINRHLAFKLKVSNLLNSGHRLTRQSRGNSNDAVVLSEYKNGVDIKLGLSYEF